MRVKVLRQLTAVEGSINTLCESIEADGFEVVGVQVLMDKYNEPMCIVQYRELPPEPEVEPEPTPETEE